MNRRDRKRLEALSGVKLTSPSIAARRRFLNAQSPFFKAMAPEHKDAMAKSMDMLRDLPKVELLEEQVRHLIRTKGPVRLEYRPPASALREENEMAEGFERLGRQHGVGYGDLVRAIDAAGRVAASGEAARSIC